jgi:hypothetical protein
MGRESLRLRNGIALRPMCHSRTGTIDFDVAVTDNRSFVYIQFRQVADGENEEIYLRPHKANLPDAVQYAPVFRGQSAWQLFHGPGNTARVPIPRNQWVHVRLVLAGQRAALYYSAIRPGQSWSYRNLPGKRGPVRSRFEPSRRRVARPKESSSRRIRTSWFGPVSVPATMPPAPERPRPANLVQSWQLSPAFVPPEGRLRALPKELLANRNSWPSYPVDGEGRLILDKHLGRAGKDARSAAVLRSSFLLAGTRAASRSGFSDEYLLFVNGKPVSGGDAFLPFDNPRGDGVLHVGQSVAYLPLQRGDNEVLIVLLDVFGGWGIIGALE